MIHMDSLHAAWLKRMFCCAVCARVIRNRQENDAELDSNPVPAPNQFLFIESLITPN